MQMSSAKKTDSNWANLPERLLETVLDRLVDVRDYVRFSAVCKHWLSTAQFHHKKLRLKPSSQKQQLPMLLVHDRVTSNYRLHSAVGRKEEDNSAANLHVPDYYTKNMRCCGSSHGWLIFIHCEKRALILFNPFTKAITYLPPPPPPILFRHRHQHDSKMYIEKVKAVLSEDPSLCPDTYQVLALCNNLDMIWLFRSRSDSWVHVKPPPHLPNGFAFLHMDDAIYYRGKFYITGKRGFIIVEDANDDPSAPRAIVQNLVLEQHPDSEWEPGKQYLAESSCNGCLLYIERGYYRRELSPRFRVYKVNLNHHELEDPMCSVLLSLGGETLFVGFNRSLSILASKFSGCQPDCIYYYIDASKGNDIGVYDIVGSRFAKRLNLTSALIGMLPPAISPPIWIVPEANLNIT